MNKRRKCVECNDYQGGNCERCLGTGFIVDDLVRQVGKLICGRNNLNVINMRRLSKDEQTSIVACVSSRV